MKFVMRLHLRLLATMLCWGVTLGVLAGCGTASAGGSANSGGAAQIDAAFIAKVEQVCTRANARMDANGTFPYQGFDPVHPDTATLPKVGAFFEPAIAIKQDVVSQLKALGEPAEGADTWKSLLALAAADAANTKAQITTALAGDKNAFVATVHTAQRLHRQLVDVSGPAAGFGTSSPCAR